MDYQKIIHQIAEEAQKELGKGKVANYIPALANIAPDKFGIAIETISGKRYSFGDYDEPFSKSVTYLYGLSKTIYYVSTISLGNYWPWKDCPQICARYCKVGGSQDSRSSFAGTRTCDCFRRTV